MSLSKSIASDNSQDAIENSELLPIGKSTVDAVPVPIRLGVNDVNNKIDKLKSASVNSVTTPNQHTEVTTTIITNQDGSVETKTSIQSKANCLPLSPKLTSPEDDSPGSPHGNFKLRSYKLKKKAAKPRKYPCKSCTVVKNSIQELNDHHKRKHEQVMCGTCNKIFDAPLQLNRHMYEHYEKTLNCDKCSRSFTFQSELDKHKVIHRNTPMFKCMKANCDRWFFRNQDLNFHLQTHKTTEITCLHCDKFTTNTDKYLKEHIKSVHSKQLPYKCTKCERCFMYRQQRKRHLSNDHKKEA